MADTKDILQRLAAEKPKRGRVTIFIDTVLYADFKKVCDKQDLAYSEVLEAFMRTVVAESQKGKRR